MNSDSVEPVDPKPALSERRQLVHRHFTAGWWGLLSFLTLGLVLEALHAFKSGIYLDVSNETRRLMWTLAHAHGTLLSLVHVAFATTVDRLPGWEGGSRSLASSCLLTGSVLLPAGFFLGGMFIYDGDPGLGIFLVPPGGLILFSSVFLTAKAVRNTKPQ